MRNLTRRGISGDKMLRDLKNWRLRGADVQIVSERNKQSQQWGVD